MVNYITASVFSIQIIFMQLSLMGFLISQENARKKYFYFFSLLLFVFSLLCHEIAMVLPFYLICVLFFIRGLDFKEILFKTLPFLCVVMFYFLFRLKFASLKVSIIDKISQFDISFFGYTGTFAKLIGWYMVRLISLKDVVFIWSTPVLKENLVFWNAVFLGLILICCYVLGRYRRWVLQAFALSWFLCGFPLLSLACFFQPTAGLMIEPHWLFFSSIGFFLLIASLLLRLKKKNNRRIGGVFLSIFLIVSVVSSRQHNFLWADEIRYCRYWLKAVPDFKSVMFYLASAYQGNREFDKAEYFYEKALANNFFDWQIYTNLGLIAQEKGDSNAALDYFQTALNYYPKSGVIYTNVGVVFSKQKDPRAEKAFLRAIDYGPSLVEPRLNLASIYQKQGREDEARKLYEEILGIDPYERNSQYALVKIYFEEGEKEKAIRIGKILLEKDLDSQRLTALGSLFAQNNLNNMALALYSKSLKQDPSNKNTYMELGKFYGNQRQFDTAIQIWQAGARLDPGDKRFQELIGQAQDFAKTRHKEK